jgi:hypothetical protein
VGPAAHRLERRRLDQAGPAVLVDVDAEVRGQLPHLPLQVGRQVVVVQGHDVEIVAGVAEGLQVLNGAPQRRPDLCRRSLVVDPLPEAVPLAVGARPADCSRIPLTTPGIGWVWCDGENEPVRVRAGWVSDDDIAVIVTAYSSPPASQPEPDHHAQVVVDLTDKARWS